MRINENHFGELVKCVRDIEKSTDKVKNGVWLGQSTQRWLSALKHKYTLNWDKNVGLDPMEVSKNGLDRYQLKKMIEDCISHRSHVDDKLMKFIVAHILAWGGQQINHGRKSLSKEHWDVWKKPCFELIRKNEDPIDSYEKFFELDQKGLLKGIGPAFYTKLIFFLGEGDGLIMDQWTSRSINLLFNDEIIKLQRGNRKTSGDHIYVVSKSNNQNVYCKYIKCVTELSAYLSNEVGQEITPPKTEEYIFSFTTDRRKTLNFLTDNEYLAATNWRRYVELNHR